MELMQLEMFVVVVEEGSVRAASERVRRDHACSNAIPNREHQAVKRGNLLIHADPFALIDFLSFVRATNSSVVLKASFAPNCPANVQQRFSFPTLLFTADKSSLARFSCGNPSLFFGPSPSVCPWEVNSPSSVSEHGQSGTTIILVPVEYDGKRVCRVKFVLRYGNQFHRGIAAVPQHQAALLERHDVCGIEFRAPVLPSQGSQRFFIQVHLLDFASGEVCCALHIEHNLHRAIGAFELNYVAEQIVKFVHAAPPQNRTPGS